VTVVVAALRAAAGADAPLVPDRDTARTWAQQELVHREYQEHRPGLIAQLWQWLTDQIDRLPQPKGVPGNVGTAIVAALLVALLVYLLWRTGSVRRRGAGDSDGVFSGPVRTAAEHRRAAADALAAGDHRVALLEGFRGLVRGMEERALLDLEPGRTADEAARAAAAALPDLADDLTAAARSFDDVRYGDLPATSDAATTMRELDDRVQRSRPAPAQPVTAGIEAPR
jgi:hypothetical protein